MTRSPLISAEELAELTGYKRVNEQRQQLDDWGIPYKSRKDGSPALTWTQWDEAFRNGLAPFKPDFSHLRKAG